MKKEAKSNSQSCHAFIRFQCLSIIDTNAMKQSNHLCLICCEQLMSRNIPLPFRGFKICSSLCVEHFKSVLVPAV